MNPFLLVVTQLSGSKQSSEIVYFIDNARSESDRSAREGGVKAASARKWWGLSTPLNHKFGWSVGIYAEHRGQWSFFSADLSDVLIFHCSFQELDLREPRGGAPP